MFTLKSSIGVKMNWTLGIAIYLLIGLGLDWLTMWGENNKKYKIFLDERMRQAKTSLKEFRFWLVFLWPVLILVAVSTAIFGEKE